MEADHDTESTYGNHLADATSSLSSSIRDYTFENGRRYHAYRSGQYNFPNDEMEADREDLKHHTTRLLLSGNLCETRFDSPPAKVLDVGTGTGIWAMQFADEHPNSHVIGIDLSPIQSKWVPSNLEYQVDDAELEWTFEDGSFDFIHIRYMSIAFRDWPLLLERCKKALRPGGKIEVADLDFILCCDDGTIAEDNQMKRFVELSAGASKKIGVDIRKALQYEDLLRDARFEHVTPVIHKLPMGPWARDPRLKEAGACMREQMLQGLSGLAMGLFTRILQWKPEEVEDFVELVKRDVANPRYHGYWKVYFVTATKPMVQENSPSAS